MSDPFEPRKDEFELKLVELLKEYNLAMLVYVVQPFNVETAYINIIDCLKISDDRRAALRNAVKKVVEDWDETLPFLFHIPPSNN